MSLNRSRSKEKNVRIHRWLIRCLSIVLLTALVSSLAALPLVAAEKLVGLQSAPSVAMALPWFAEEARLYPKYDLEF